MSGAYKYRPQNTQNTLGPDAPASPVAPVPLSQAEFRALERQVQRFRITGENKMVEIPALILSELLNALAPVATGETAQDSEPRADHRAYFHKAIDRVQEMRKLDLERANDPAQQKDRDYYLGRAHRCDDILFWLGELESRLPAGTDTDDNYVAWLQFHRGSVRTCDSDAEGAFKVYRAAQPAGTPEQVRKDALEQAAQLANERIREHGFYAAYAEQVAREIRAIATPPPREREAGK